MTTTVTRHKLLGLYLAVCPSCGLIAQSQTGKTLMQRQAEEHDAWHADQEHVNELCQEFGIEPVKLEVSNKKVKNFGRAIHKPRILELNGKLTGAAKEDTIRHELAHFIAFDRYNYVGHGETWKRACEITGAIPKEYAEVTPEDAHEYGVKYVYMCAEGCIISIYKGLQRTFQYHVCTQHRLPIHLVSDFSTRREKKLELHS